MATHRKLTDREYEIQEARTLKKLRESLREVTCEIELWIERNDCPERLRQIKRLDKAVFLIKVGAKIMKKAE